MTSEESSLVRVPNQECEKCQSFTAQNDIGGIGILSIKKTSDFVSLVLTSPNLHHQDHLYYVHYFHYFHYLHYLLYLPRLQQCPAVKPVNSNNLIILCAPISATCCIHTATNSIGKLASKSRTGISSFQMPLTRSRGQSYVAFPKTLPRPKRN